MMTPTDLRDAIINTAAVAQGALQAFRATQQREDDGGQWRELYVLERGRLAALLWAAMGMYDSDGRSLSPYATRQASAVAAKGISVDELLADPLLVELHDASEEHA